MPRPRALTISRGVTPMGTEMPTLTIHNCDNIETLRRFAANGDRFDLAELDGPYGANLEGWDILTDDQYLAHYTERLPLVRDVLQPWAVAFLFGYPEGCAEIKAWARQSGTLHLRRWLTWYKQRTAHKGRKCETILYMSPPPTLDLWTDFRAELTRRRMARGWTIGMAMAETPCRRHLAGKGAGAVWFEAPSSGVPSAYEYLELKEVFSIPDEYDYLCTSGDYDGITNIDYISATYPEDTRELNDAGLRSKPVGLYLDLFRPTVPPRETRRALILYGGSGNAAIAAGKLGYNVDICEADPARCEMIRRRWAWQVERRDETPTTELGPLFNMEAA